MVAASAEADIATVSAATIATIRPGAMRGSLLQLGGDLFGVLLVALENLQAGLQQALQFRVVRGRNKLRLKRAIDRLVIGDFVVGIGFVERGALELAELGELVGGILRQGLAGVVVFRL